MLHRYKQFNSLDIIVSHIAGNAEKRFDISKYEVETPLPLGKTKID